MAAEATRPFPILRSDVKVRGLLSQTADDVHVLMVTMRTTRV